MGNYQGGQLLPQPVDRLLLGGVPSRGGGLPLPDNNDINTKQGPIIPLQSRGREGYRETKNAIGPPDYRHLPRAGRDSRSSNNTQASLQEKKSFGRFSRGGEPSLLTRPQLEEDQFCRQRPPPHFSDRGGGSGDRTFGRPLSLGVDQQSSLDISGSCSGHHHSNSLLMNGRFVPDFSRSSTSVSDVIISNVEDDWHQQQPQHPIPGSPLQRESSHNGSMAQRFDGHDHGNNNSSISSNMNRSRPPPVPARSNDHLVSTMLI